MKGSAATDTFDHDDRMTELERYSAPIARDGRGRFVPGGSPNPGGRPRELREIIALARTFTEEAVATLREIMLDPTMQGMARVKAADLILTRGWGVPLPEGRADALVDDAEVIQFTMVLGDESKLHRERPDGSALYP